MITKASNGPIRNVLNGSICAPLKHYLGYNDINPRSDLMSGVDGALSINGTAAYIDAGDIKRYSSISIINGGALIVRGFSYYGVSNSGFVPTIIGCSGNCTINTGGQIVCKDNAGFSGDFYEDTVYSAPVVPFDCVVNPVSYTRFGAYGGAGGETSGYGSIAGYDVYISGHGGGGSGGYDGGNTNNAYEWASSGYGAQALTGLGPAGPEIPLVNGFGAAGSIGLGGENSGGVSVGGGGSGGLRGLSGGALVLQVQGISNIDANSIDLTGSDGGNGGGGGLANSPDSDAYGGGGGGGGSGGGGGYGWIRYRFTGSTVDPGAISITAGLPGIGGAGGIAISGASVADGFPGQDGTGGLDGTYDITTYLP